MSDFPFLKLPDCEKKLAELHEQITVLIATNQEQAQEIERLNIEVGGLRAVSAEPGELHQVSMDAAAEAVDELYELIKAKHNLATAYKHGNEDYHRGYLDGLYSAQCACGEMSECYDSRKSDITVDDEFTLTDKGKEATGGDT